MSVQIVLTADNHLDPPAVRFGSKRYERKMDFLRCFEHVCEYALKEKPDLFLVAGDLFDHILPRNPTRARVMKLFKELYEKGVKIFLISGHHDTPKNVEQGSSPLATFGNSGYTVFFQDPSKIESYTMSINGLRVAVSGLSYDPTLPYDQDPLEDKRIPINNDINVFMLHYPIVGFEGYIGYEPTVHPEFIPKGIHLLACGHFHKYQESVINDVYTVYPGSTERVTFKEESEDKGFVWLEIDREGVIAKDFIKTPARPMRTIDFTVSEKGDLDEQLIAFLDSFEDKNLILRLRLKGVIDVARLSTYRRTNVLSHAQDKFFTLLIEEEDLEIETEEVMEPLPRTTPLEEVRRYFQALISKAKEQERAVILEAQRLCESKLQEAGAW